MQTTSFTITHPESRVEPLQIRRIVHSSPAEVTFSETTPLIEKEENGRADYTIPEEEMENSNSRSYSQRHTGLFGSHLQRAKPKDICNSIKIFVLFACIIVASVLIAMSHEAKSHFHQYVINTRLETVHLDRPNYVSGIMLRLRGAFTHSYFSNTKNLTLSVLNPKNNSLILKSIQVPYIDHGKETIYTQYIDLEDSIHLSQQENLTVTMQIKNWFPSLPVGLDYQVLRYHLNDAIYWGAAILILVYVLISFELVHRTVAAAVGSLLVMAVLSVYNLRPSMTTILSWIDFETLMLLFGMMLIVGIFSETGFFDWVALGAYKVAHGRVFLLAGLLCAVAAVVSAFLDNVTTILLMAPVTIRLCEALRIEPQKLLLAEVIFSNIGGAATAVGDPPNVIIVSNEDLRKAAIDAKVGSINFVSFIAHMGLGSLFVLAASAFLMRFLLRDISSNSTKIDYEVIELRREVEVWRKSAMAISMATREEGSVRALLLAKGDEARARLRRHESMNRRSQEEGFRAIVNRLESEYKITNPVLLVKTLLVLLVVIVVFIVSSLVANIHLDLGWIAFLGSVWLLLLSDHQELDTLMHRIEWSTLIFFAALFTFMKGVEQLGLISFIGDNVAWLISRVDSSHRLLVAILLVQWVSAIVSAVIDNIPFTTAMIPVIVSISHTDVPLLPLVWALAFGTCLGGNGTLIGASANVVAVGIADQHGYNISFRDFFKIGFPMMIFSNLIAMCYLLICHIAVSWNSY